MGYGDLSIQDWREIRVGNYWEIRDSLKSDERDSFIWSRIEALNFKEYGDKFV